MNGVKRPLRGSMAARIAQLLQGRRGAAMAISAPDICIELEWEVTLERTVRSIIGSSSQDWGDGLLCAIPGKGYFFGETLEEIEAYRAYLLNLQDIAWDKRNRFDCAALKAGFNLQGVRE